MPLVSKRFAALCRSPELLRDIDAGWVSSLVVVRSLTAWLVRLGRHVRKLKISFPAFEDWDWHESEDAPPAVAACLGAAGAVGVLEELSVWSVPGSEWLAAMPSLRRLVLMARGLGQELVVSPAIGMLTNLESLELGGRPIFWVEGCTLPASITRLHLQDSEAYDFPDQVGACLAQLPPAAGRRSLQLSAARSAVAT